MRLLFPLSYRKLAEDMHQREPQPISAVQRRARIQRVRRIARRLGFVGHVEYRHVYSQSGGAQYCTGPTPGDDLLLVYVEAFERDADPHDFALEAMIAHECGHQALVRNPQLRAILRKFPGERFEEILASLLGSLLLGESETSRSLVWKATAELADFGMAASNTIHFIERLRGVLKHFV